MTPAPLTRTPLAWSLALIASWSSAPLASAQECPSFAAASSAVRVAAPVGGLACVGEALDVTVSGALPGGFEGAADVELHAGPTADFAPAAATLVGRRRLRAPYDPGVLPRFKGHTMWGCGDERNEYSVLFSGGGIVVSEVEARFDPRLNEGCAACEFPGAAGCPWRPAAEVSRLRAGACGEVRYAGPGDTIPPNAMVVLLYSALFDLPLDIGPLCREGDPVYVIQASCTRLDGGVVRDAIYNLAQGQPYPGMDGTYYELVAAERRLAGWRIAGLGEGPGHYESTPPPGQPSRGRIDCAAPVAWATSVGVRERSSGQATGGRATGGYAFDFSFAPASGACGEGYLRAVVRTDDGACAAVSDAASYTVACPRIALAGTQDACVGDAATLTVAATDVPARTAAEIRVGDGPWRALTIRRGTGTLPYAFTDADEGAAQRVRLRTSATGTGGCPIVVESVATVTVGGAACATCTPPEPRFISNARTTYCAELSGSLPFALRQNTPGFEEVLLLYAGETPTPEGLLRDFGTTTPDWSDIYAAAGATTTFSLVVRRRSLTDPNCFADARPYVVVFEPKTTTRIFELCEGGEVTLPDGSILTEARRTAEYISPGPTGCDTLVSAVAQILPATTPGCGAACDPPDPGQFRPEFTTYCDAAIFSGGTPPFTPGDARAGYEIVFLLFDDTPARNLLATFGGGLPTWDEVFAAAGEVDPFVLVARARSVADPACFRDSRDYPLIRLGGRETASRTIALCPGQTVTLPDGTTVSAARRTAEYVAPGPDACTDTLVTVTTTLGDNPIAQRTVGACGAAAFTLPDGTVLDAARPTATYRAAGPAGACDTLVTATFAPPAAPTDERTVRSCAGGTFPLPDGTRLDADRPTGTYTAPAPGGACDSVVTVTLDFAAELTRTDDYPLCAGETVTLPTGAVLDEAQPAVTYVAAGTAGACDTTVTAVATFADQLTAARTVGACGATSVTLPDGTVLDAARPTATYRAAGPAGACDTLVTATFAPPAVPTAERTVRSCAGGTYVLPDGTVLDAARPTGTYTAPAPGDGCDSVVTVTLDFAAALTRTDDYPLCAGETVTLSDGTVLDEGSPEYTYVAPGTNGACDTTVTAVATFAPPPARATTVTVCTGGTFALPDGTVLDAARPTGTYTAAAPGGACDSVVTVTLDFLPALTRTDDYPRCAGETVTLPDGTVLDEGNPESTYVAFGTNGACDTTVTAVATFADQLTAARTVGACGDVTYVLPDGTQLTADAPEGTYVAAGPAGACDTLVTVTFAPPPAPTDERTVTSCAGGSVALSDGSVLDADRPTGTYTAPAPDGACDSVVTVTLAFLPTITRTDAFPLCTGQTATLPDGTVLDEASPESTYVAAGTDGACDTIVTAVATFAPPPTRATTLNVCAGGSVALPDGTRLDAARPSGTYVVDVDGGCDSVITVTLSFAAALERTDTYPICTGGSVTVADGVVLDAANPTVVYVAAGADGACDTTVTAVATFATQLTETRAFGDCGEASVVLPDGTALSAARATATYTAAGVDGACDTLVTAVFTGEPFPARDTLVRLCPGQRFVLPDGSFLGTGQPERTYRKPATEAGACDTLVTARLVEGAPATEERVERTVCPGEVVTVGGERFGESRTEGVVVVPGTTGCDSLRYVVSLTVLTPPPPATDTVTARRGEEVTLLPRADVETADVTWASPLLSCQACGAPTLTALTSAAFAYAYTSAAGCLLRDAVYVLVVEEPIAEPSGRRRILVPNAFSPNDDGVNDALLPRCREPGVVVLRWEIYDRWGGRLFSRGDFAAGDERGAWDGESDGEPLDTGVYVWVVRARWPDGTEAEAAGEITLVR